MNYKKMDIVSDIYFHLFGFKNGYELEKNLGFDVSFRSKQLDITDSSYNFDFQATTYQSKDENIYFNISLFDYETGKTYDAGYFYIKDNNGIINGDHLRALAKIIEVGNEYTENIFINREA